MTQPDRPVALFALNPTIFVIFGITGDLASRKLIPALLNLYTKKLLPSRFAILGFSRRMFNREEFREFIRSRMNVRLGQFKEEDIKHFLDHMSYEQGMFDDAGAYIRLASKMKNIDDRWGQCSNKLYHLSVPPTLYEKILSNIARSGLAQSCGDGSGWTRVLIEKPFEKWGMDGRGAFYDPIGALKDVGQNHMLMMLAIVAMEAPDSFKAKDIRCERAKILEKLKLMTGRSIRGRVVRGQYMGYMQESGISAQSQTETYFRIQALINSSRWKDVPFYLESGKAMSESKVEIDVYFKKGERNDRQETGVGDAENKQNILTFRIQPEEGIRIRFFVKVPGYDYITESKTLKFKYADVASFDIISNDYERLIHDAFIGDQALFASTDEIMASWKFMMSILNNLRQTKLVLYEKGAEYVE